jgi:PadR family transcriptional regulator, regulatory protein PadR
MSQAGVERVERELLRGAGPTAVLVLLGRREMYGYELAELLGEQTGGALAMGHSTLYPLLYNLEAKGLITSTERSADSGRVRRYYCLTANGRKALKLQRAQWQTLADALTRLGVITPSASSAPSPAR